MSKLRHKAWKPSEEQRRKTQETIKQWLYDRAMEKLPEIVMAIGAGSSPVGTLYLVEGEHIICLESALPVEYKIDPEYEVLVADRMMLYFMSIKSQVRWDELLEVVPGEE